MLKKVLCFLFLAVVMVTTIPKTVERGSCVYHTVKCTSYQCSTCNKVIPGKPGDHHGSTVLVRDGMCDYHTECEGCGKTIATGKDHSWVSKNCTEGVWCADCGEQNSRSEHEMKERLAGVYSRCIRCGYIVFAGHGR